MTVTGPTITVVVSSIKYRHRSLWMYYRLVYPFDRRAACCVVLLWELMLDDKSSHGGSGVNGYCGFRGIHGPRWKFFFFLPPCLHWQYFVLCCAVLNEV